MIVAAEAVSPSRSNIDVGPVCDTLAAARSPCSLRAGGVGKHAGHVRQLLSHPRNFGGTSKQLLAIESWRTELDRGRDPRTTHSREQRRMHGRLVGTITREAFRLQRHHPRPPHPKSLEDPNVQSYFPFVPLPC